MENVKEFINKHYHHYNSRVLKESAEALSQHFSAGGKMLLALGGAMSTAKMGIIIAEMIRHGKIHAISTTGANLEEDVYNLICGNDYVQAHQWQSGSVSDDANLLEGQLNRVLDVCIPESVMCLLVDKLKKYWRLSDKKGESFFPFEYIYKLFENNEIEFGLNPNDSWVYTAWKHNIPIWTPGWEDSTSANKLVSHIISGELTGGQVVKDGLMQMESIVSWYKHHSADHSIAFFQIGGGIAGDFPICAVPLITQDLEQSADRWGYFCQISDSTTSYGSYSGALPREKITWGKLSESTPMFMIESDATIVAPLIFQYTLES